MGCLEDDCESTLTYQRFDPIYITAGEWRSEALNVTAPPEDETCSPSGFYIYGDYLFMVDKAQGIHILDNEDNDNPEPVAFIPMRGGQSIAARNGVLYVNQFTDLLAFNLQNPAEPKLLSRTEDVFEPQTIFGSGVSANSEQFILDWEATDETVEVDCNAPTRNFWLEDDMLLFDFAATNFSSTAGTRATSIPEMVGLGGSLARFTITNSTLYSVDEQNLNAFSLADAANPAFAGKVPIGWDIETIFPYGDKVFIGSSSAMYIYDVSDPLVPQQLSMFSHVTGCDPVVVQGDMAYVTIWGGSSCGDLTDRLMAVDVSNPSNPRLVQEIAIENSHGLGVDEDYLYMATGPDGIQVFELQRDGKVGGRVHQESSFDAKDIIVRPDREELIVFGWGDAGIRQYDYAGEGRLNAVSDFAGCR